MSVFSDMPIMQCRATVSDPRLRENLCQCAKILGGSPKVMGDTVTVVARYNIGKMVALFEQFHSHEIKSLR